MRRLTAMTLLLGACATGRPEKTEPPPAPDPRIEKWNREQQEAIAAAQEWKAAAAAAEKERQEAEIAASKEQTAALPAASTIIGEEDEREQVGVDDPPPTKEQREADRRFRKLQSTPKGRRIVHGMILNGVIREKYDDTMEVFASGKAADVLVFESPHCGEGKGALYELMENIETRRELKSLGFKLIVCQGGRFRESWLPSGAAVR